MRILHLWLTAIGKKTKWLLAWRFVAVAGLFLLFGAGFAYAQNVCVNPAFKGEFTVNKTRVCVGERVDITSPPNIVNVGYNPQYDGKDIPASASLTQSTSFTYAQPGSYTIIQVGSGGGTGTIACQEVTVVAREPVAFTPITCSGRKVTLDIRLDGATSQYDQYVINWGDGPADVKTRAEVIAQKPAHTYSANGSNTATIAVYGIYGSPGAISCEGPATTSKVTLSGASTVPSITKLITTGDNSITIQYQANTGVGVELFQKNASGLYESTNQKGTSAGTFLVQTNAKQEQCFQVVSQAQDACNAAGQRSDEICSLVLTANAINKINDLSWNPYAGTISVTTQFRQYRINRNGSPLIIYFDRNVGDHRDVSKIECGTQYCYTLETTITGAVETVVTSAPVCVTGINGDLPDNFRNVLVSIENNHPRLVAALPTTGTSSSYTLAVSRADGPSGTFQPVGTVANKNTFIDETANPSAGPYCYQLTYLANCGLSSPPSQPVCTVFLGSQSSASIDWTAASPFTPGSVVGYTVEVTDSVSGTNREIQAGGNLRYEPDPNDPTLRSQKYRIIAVSNTGQRSYSNYFTLRRESIILLPDAFTPNGDGLNDEFAAKGIYVDRFNMTIYDRWGQVIYATSDKTKGWDGTADGQSLAAGQYMYRIDVQDLTGLKTVRTGTVLLIR